MSAPQAVAWWNVKAWRPIERAWGEDHEKVQVEPAPIHFAQAGDARLHRNTLHIEREFVTHTHVQIFSDLFFKRKRRGLARGWASAKQTPADKLLQ